MEKFDKEIKEEILENKKDLVEIKENKKEEATNDIKEDNKDKNGNFKVVKIVNDKVVMVRGLKDNLLYSKPNKGYTLSQIIK